MKRYDSSYGSGYGSGSGGDCWGEMDEDDKGEYVLYNDVEVLIKENQRNIKLNNKLLDRIKELEK